MKTPPLFLASLLWLGLAASGQAQVQPRPLVPLTMSSEPGPLAFRSVHEGTFNGKQIRYEAEVSQAIIKDGAGHPTAQLVSYAYVGKAPNSVQRPVIFFWNGGPGAPSVFLHFGSLGPEVFKSENSEVLEDNPMSPLDAADLVFLDPPNTGYSKVLPGVSPQQFYSIDGDSEAMSQAIVNWLRAHDRLASNVYLYGESYGSMRAVAVARDLTRGQPKVNVAGVFIAANSLGYMQKGQMPDILFEANALPMMASVAWHYGKIDRSQTWELAVDKARVFARTTYIDALMQGHRLDAETREKVVRRLPAIIGIPESYFRANNTIVVKDFLGELLRDQGLRIDDNNGLITHAVDEPPEDIVSQLQRYSKAMAGYIKGDLKASGLGDFVIFNPRAPGAWDYYTAGDMALDVTLAKVMRDNPKLRVMLVQGRYDTLTTIGNSEYIMRQADLDWSRYTEANYDAGHTLRPLPEIISAIRAFVTASGAGPS